MSAKHRPVFGAMRSPPSRARKTIWSRPRFRPRTYPARVIAPTATITTAALRTAGPISGGADASRQALCCIQSATAARIRISAVVGFVATCPGNPLLRYSISRPHPTRTTRPTSTTNTLHPRLNAAADAASSGLASGSRAGVPASSRSFMARAPGHPGGVAARRGRGSEHALAGTAWSDSPSRRQQNPPPYCRARTER
jgi:hypothetical protein